jgi:hypothetical protein
MSTDPRAKIYGEKRQMWQKGARRTTSQPVSTSRVEKTQTASAFSHICPDLRPNLEKSLNTSTTRRRRVVEVFKGELKRLGQGREVGTSLLLKDNLRPNLLSQPAEENRLGRRAQQPAQKCGSGACKKNTLSRCFKAKHPHSTKRSWHAHSLEV